MAKAIKRGGRDLDGIYRAYLDWFHAHTDGQTEPFAKDELEGFRSFQEDVFETDRFLLNRVYYAIPLSPVSSRDGAFHIFSFSELNLLEQDPDTLDIREMTTVEYSLHP